MIASLLERFKKYINDNNQLDMGCSIEEIDHYKSKSKQIAPEKKICVIKDWEWWDVDLHEQHRAIIYSESVLSCETKDVIEGESIKSTFLLDVHCNCLFETQDTIYILVGQGTQKNVAAHKVTSAFQ